MYMYLLLQVMKQVIGEHHSWDVEFFSFTQVPTVQRKDLEEVGIKSHVDVGKWIVKTMRDRLDQNDLAEQLERSFSDYSDHSCYSQ